MPKHYEDGDLLRFGKHTGWTIDQAIAEDPDWVQWACDNIERFGLSEELEALLEKSLRADQ